MGKPAKQYEVEHEAFRARLQKIHQGPIGKTARSAMNALRQAYYEAALEHWKELGNRASTGWSQPPEADFQTPSPPKQCAATVRDTLARHFAINPNDPPGSRKGE